MASDDRLFDFADIPARAQEQRGRKRGVPTPFEEIRAMHSWTLDKLQVLELYLKLYRRVAGNGTYLDAFAGEGRIAVKGKPRDGSALVAARAGAFKRLFFMEIDRARNSSLRRHLDDLLPPRTAERCTVLPAGDANVQIPALLAGGDIERARPMFAMLDPDSTQLHWATVEALAGYKQRDETGCKVELWILFNTHQAMQRIWPIDRSRPNPFAQVLDRVLGDRGAWIDLFTENKSAKHLMIRYAHRLQTELGYLYVNQQAITDRVTGRDQYHMIHASDHAAADGFMTWARRASDKDQQRALAEELPFPPGS
jgi:three-Cys-motif partner protein